MKPRIVSILPLLIWLIAAPAHAASPGSAALTRALDLLASRPGVAQEAALAAEVGPEGHWTFANAAREGFTAGTADELKRVLPTLLPEAAKVGTRLTLAVTEDAVFRYRAHFLALTLAAERRTDVLVAVGQELQPLVRRGDRGKEQLFVEARPNVLVELSERRLLDEAVWQLSHPLRRSAVRVVAVETNGPENVSASPQLDPQTKRALTDMVAPAGLERAIRTLTRQTVILTARRDGDVLSFRPASGPENTRPLKDVLEAAEAADVNLVILHASNPRQPGATSWWWGRISVERLDDAIGRDHLIDFLNALASPQGKLIVSAQDEGKGRVRLVARALKDESSPRTGIGEALSELASNIVGQVVVSGVEASLRGSGRQAELDRRLVPGLPSLLQWAYAALVLLGLAGHTAARAWWARIWPVERREGYAGPVGYLLAKGVRGMAYFAGFMPLVAIASAPAALVRAMRGKATPASSTVATG